MQLSNSSTSRRKKNRWEGWASSLWRRGLDSGTSASSVESNTDMAAMSMQHQHPLFVSILSAIHELGKILIHTDWLQSNSLTFWEMYLLAKTWLQEVQYHSGAHRRSYDERKAIQQSVPVVSSDLCLLQNVQPFLHCDYDLNWVIHTIRCVTSCRM